MAFRAAVVILAGEEPAMQTPPALFDPDLLAVRRARAARIGGADFLHAAVAAEIAERLKEVKRSFRAPAVIGPRADLWADTLEADGLPPARRIPDTEVLDLAPEAHDLVVHGLALHWSNDPVGQLVQMRRALRPDGLMLAALFGGETLHELRAALAEAEIACFGGLSPRVAPMGEIRDLGGLLQRAGLALPVADSQRFYVRYASPLALMRDLRAMGETNVLRDRMRRPMPRAMLAHACALYAAHFGGEDGRIAASFDVIFLTGWAPAPNQQQPLRPGSAAMRLADALGADARSAGETAGGRRPDPRTDR
jgi:SAM-dependent methyltransferase